MSTKARSLFVRFSLSSLLLILGVPVFAQFSGDTSTQDFAGNVGIGISYPTLPAGKLEVINPTGTGGTGSYLQVTGSTADNSHYPDIVLKGGNGVGYTINAYPSIRLSNAGFALALWGAYSSVAAPNPVAAVVDSGSGSFYVASGVTGSNVPFRVWSSGSIGVGTAAIPSASVDVRGASQASGSARRNVVAVDTTAWAQGVGGGISFGGNTGTDGGGNQVASLDLANIWGVKENSTASDTSGALLFATHANGGTPAERMRITSGGSVGIGTTPAAGNLLDVAGNIHASGSITGGSVIGATYQDVAEWVPAGEAMEPGTVVVLDHAKVNEVVRSRSAYDTSIAGVVSAHPGVILGVPSDAKAQVATTGRVKVKVDATRHPVAIGDLLVTSDKPGMAMVSEPIELGGTKIHRPGTLIGKALEPLASGEGEILVLLSLQ